MKALRKFTSAKKSKFSKEKFQAWDQLDKEVDPLFINFIPDELFLKIRKELQENKTTGDLIGWGDDVSTIRRRISETPDDIVSRRGEGVYLWDVDGTNGDIISINNDSRRTRFSEDSINRIRRLMGTQNNQTISSEPNVNYTSNFGDYVRQFMGGSETYLDDLP